MGRHLERGRVLFQLGRYRESIDEFSKELTENPNSVEALSRRAAALVNLGQNRKGQLEIRRAIALDPEDDFSHYVHSCALSNLGRSVAAKAAVLEALRLAPAAEYFHRLAEIHWHKSRVNECLSATSDALALDSRYVPSLCLRAQALTSQGRGADAKSLLLTTLSLQAEDADAHQSMGALIMQTGKSKDAVGFLREARRLRPTTHNDRNLFALAYGRLLWPFRIFDSPWFRIECWTPTARWSLLALLATLLLVISMVAGGNQQDVTLFVYVATFNILALRVTSDMLALAVGKAIFRRELDLPWYKLLPEVIRFIAPLYVHAMVSGIAIVCAVAQPLAFMTFAIAISFEAFLRICRAPRFLEKLGMLCFVAFGIVTPAMLAAVFWEIDGNLVGVAICWAITLLVSYICTVHLR